jgi:hypothetical protein
VREKNICQQYIAAGLWIRIRIASGFNDFVDRDPDLESGFGSKGKKIKIKIHFLVDF